MSGRHTRILCGILTIAVASARLLQTHLLHPPLTYGYEGGLRRISGWRTGGNTKAQEHFIRLTPESKDAHGWLWSERPLNVEELSLVAKVRMSGRNTNSFGESLGIWITTRPNMQLGTLHGFTTEFQGLGVVLVARGAEHVQQEAHVYLNSGRDDPLRVKEPYGTCSAEVRAAETRGDWSFSNATLVKLALTGSTLRVELDPSGRGWWQDCVAIRLTPKGQLSSRAEWLARAHVGVTARTSEFVDNHDVLAVHVYDNARDADYFGRFHVHEYHTPLQQKMLNWEHQFVGIEDELGHTVEELRSQQEAAERGLLAIERNVSSAFDADWERRVRALEQASAGLAYGKEQRLSVRIARAEENNWHRTEIQLRELEARVEEQLYDKLVTRISIVERKLSDEVETRIAKIERSMLLHIQDRASDATRRVGRSWWLPFSVILFGSSVLIVMLWLRLRFVALRLLERMNRLV